MTNETRRKMCSILGPKVVVAAPKARVMSPSSFPEGTLDRKGFHRGTSPASPKET
jgi:hypothetical protein